METAKKIPVTWGVILGVILIILTTLVYAMDLTYFTSAWYGIAAFLLVIGLGVTAAIKTKKEIGGFITFKQSFRAFFITVFIGFLMSTLFSMLLLNVIDTEAKQIINENIIEYTVSMMEKMGTPSSAIEEVVTEMENKDSFGPMGMLQGFLFNILFYCVIGLIASLIIKRDRPESL